MSQPKKKFGLEVILKPMQSVRSKVVSNPKVSLAVGFVFLMVLGGGIIILFEMQRKSTETKGTSVQTSACVS